MRKLPYKVLILCLLLLGSALLIYKWEKIFVNTQHLYYKISNCCSIPILQTSLKSASRIEVRKFQSIALNGEKRELQVYLPRGYYTDFQQRFPVLYLLHGYPGSNMDWLTNVNLKNSLDILIMEGKIVPLIVVFPDGNGTYVSDSQYLNATRVEQHMETYLASDVVNYVDKNFHTKATRGYRAIGGLSSGAYGAVNVALRNNKVFGFSISHSGYFLNHESALTLLLGDNSKVIHDNNPLMYIKSLPLDPDTFVYFDIGRNDSDEFLTQNKNMNKELEAKKIPHKFVITDGSHNWEMWGTNIKSSLLELDKYFKQQN